MECDSDLPKTQSKIHFNPKHLISSTVHINPKVLKNRTIHINPNCPNFKGVRSNSVHINPKLIGNFNLNNFDSTHDKNIDSISINNDNLVQKNNTNNINSHLLSIKSESKVNSNEILKTASSHSINKIHQRTELILNENRNQLVENNSNLRISCELTSQNRLTQVLSLKNTNPLISLSKTKLIRKENIINKSSLKNDNNPLISLSKTKLIRKETPEIKKNDSNLPLISISKTKLVRKQNIPSEKTNIKKLPSPSIVSLSKTKLIRNNSTNSIVNNQQKKNKTSPLSKQTNKANIDTLISVSRNKLIRKNSQSSKKKICRKSAASRKSLNKSLPSKTSISQYKLVRNSIKKLSPNSKISNTFKLDNRKLQTNQHELKSDSHIRKISQSISETNKNTTLLKARAVVRNARKRAVCPKIEGLVWMRNGAKLLPVCRYFLAGCCVKDSCPYLHVKHSIKAPICLAFLRGQCAQEEKCIRRHVFICPRWDRYGSCSLGKKCQWPHIRRRTSIKANIKPKEIKKYKRNLPSKSNRKSCNENLEDRQETKRYYQQEGENQNDTKAFNEAPGTSKEIVADNGNNDNNNNNNNNDDDDDKHIFSKRPKIGILPAFIPLS